MPFGIQALAEVAHQVSVEAEAVIDPTRNETQLQVAEQIWRIHDGVVDEHIFSKLWYLVLRKS